MKRETREIGGAQVLFLGEKTESLYLFLHGQGGNREEAAAFAETVCEKGWQVLSLDFPEHGERKDEPGFDPWHVVPELRRVMDGVRPLYRRFALRANSIGAWFAMLALAAQPLERCLFASPVVDMTGLIETMMRWAGVTPRQLEEARVIKTSFGQTLSWEYFVYAREHPIAGWKSPTFILYGENDAMVERRAIEEFTRKYGCGLTVMPGGEHWFHTPPQLEALKRWEAENFESPPNKAARL